MRLLEAVKDGIVVTMPEEGILQIRQPGNSRWVEVRGQYNSPNENDPFMQVINRMAGSKVSRLFADQQAYMQPSDQGYDYLLKIVSQE